MEVITEREKVKLTIFKARYSNYIYSKQSHTKPHKLLPGHSLCLKPYTQLFMHR